MDKYPLVRQYNLACARLLALYRTFYDSRCEFLDLTKDYQKDEILFTAEGLLYVLLDDNLCLIALKGRRMTLEDVDILENLT